MQKEKKAKEEKRIKEIFLILILSLTFLFITATSNAGTPNIIVNTHNISQLNNDAGFITSDTDTNETPRFDNLTAIDCGTLEKQIGIQNNGTILCAEDSATNSSYALNQTITDLLPDILNRTNESYYLASNPEGFFNNLLNFTDDLQDNGICFYNITSGYLNCTGVDLTGGNTTTEIFIAVDNGTFAYNQTLADMWELFLNTTNLSYALNQTLTDMWSEFLNTTNITYVEHNANFNDSNNIVPSLNDSFDLGNSTNRFNELWVYRLQMVTQISTSQIADAIITAVKLGLNSVNTSHIVNGTILSGDLNAEVNQSFDRRYRNLANETFPNATILNNATVGGNLTANNRIYIPFGVEICWGNSTNSCWVWSKGNTTGFFALGGGGS